MHDDETGIKAVIALERESRTLRRSQVSVFSSVTFAYWVTPETMPMPCRFLLFMRSETIVVSFPVACLAGD